ncbi:MAG TPA: transglutaminase family protein [Bryobacteraceae bacterium]|jgi:transglutaminase-like putative cysteine protease|nr:transglutaminase family protein [Bryobacteraceae bacterium]
MALNRYKLAHVTLFSYDGPVSESYNELRLRPRHDETQSCLSFRLTTTPFSRPAAHLDYFNNWVHQFHILPEHRELRVESEAIVLVHPASPYDTRAVPLQELDGMSDALREEHYDWLSASQYCPLLPALSGLIQEVEARCDSTVRSFADTAATLIHERFTYKKGATHVHSSVEDCLVTRAGVCQDFSHLLIALLRMRGIPARYVSGYLVPLHSHAADDARAAMENVIGGQASHAWVQAHIPETGWIGLDPTVGHFVEEQHILVARGRDYGDVPPVRGVYKGHAGQSLSVDVLVRPALDDEGAELLQKTSAAPPPRPDAEQQQQQQQQQ